jgi:hypothetical protein
MGNGVITDEAEADLANNNDPNNNAEEFEDVLNRNQVCKKNRRTEIVQLVRTLKLTFG